MIEITQDHVDRIPGWAIPTLMVIKCYKVPPDARIIGIADMDRGKNPESVGMPVVKFNDKKIGLLEIGSILLPLGKDQRILMSVGPQSLWDFWLLDEDDRAYFEVPEAGNVALSLDELITSEMASEKNDRASTCK